MHKFKEYDHLAPYKLNIALIKTVEDNNLELLSYLLTSPNIFYKPDIAIENHFIFRHACETGNLTMVKFLLTSPELKEHSDIHAFNDYGLRYAMKNKHYDLVKFLTSRDLKESVNINVVKDDIVHYLFSSKDTSYQEKFDLIKYFLTSLELKEKLIIYAGNNEIFRQAVHYYIQNNSELLNFLVFDYQIKKDSSIEQFLNTVATVLPNDPVLHIFEDQAIYIERNPLFQELKNNMPNHDSSNETQTKTKKAKM